MDSKSTLVARTAEPVFNGLQLAGGLDERVRHRHRPIRFVVRKPRRSGDQRERYQFPNEHDATPRRAVLGASDIKAQIHFLEIAMKKRRDIQHVRVEKQKTDEADEMASRTWVELRSLGHERLEHRGLYLEIEHREVAPLGGEKDLLHSLASIPARAASDSASRFTWSRTRR